MEAPGGAEDLGAEQAEAEELLSAGRRLPGWARVAAGAAAVLVGGYLGVHALSTHHSQPHRAALPAASGSAQVAPPLFRSPGGPRMINPPLVCGDGLAPLVSRANTASRTRLQLLVGGTRLQRVDFDTGRSSALAQPALRPDEWVARFGTAGGRRYAATSDAQCDSARSRVLSVHGGSARLVTTRQPGQIVSDGTRVWTVVNPPHALHPLEGGHDVALPAGFDPAAATNGAVIGNLESAMDSAEIGVVDAASGALHAAPGMGVVLAAARGRYVWSAGCGAGGAGPCVLHSATVRGTALRTYRLPRAPGSPAARLSPDGRTLAFTLARTHIDRYHRQGNPSPASDVALLDVRTGRLTVVPGIELPARYEPQFAFAPAGDWLVLTATDNGRTRLLAWRKGLAHPLISPLRDATSPAPPPVTVLAG